MAGNRTRLLGSQSFTKQRDDNRIEPATASKKIQQHSSARFATRLRNRDPASARPPKDRLSIKGAAGRRGCTVEHLGRQNSSKTSQRSLPRSSLGRFTFPNFEGFSLLSYRGHDQGSHPSRVSGAVHSL
jgi:hypothetical protein